MSRVKDFFSDDGQRKAVIHLSKETFSIDFFENDEYIWTLEYPNNSINYVENIAEDWILGKLNSVKDH